MGPPHHQEEESVMVGGGGGSGGSRESQGEDGGTKAALAARVRAQMDTQAQASFMDAVGDMLVCPLW